MKQVCLKCRSSQSLHWGSGEWYCTRCEVRFSRACVKMYNRWSRIRRLGHYQIRGGPRNGMWTPTSEECDAQIAQCYTSYDSEVGYTGF